MPTLSVAMIVKNEAEYLSGCLGSVRCIADEIVVCDTGSDDNTIEIAESFNAAVYRIEWKNDFAQARNQALARVNGDWILHVDADEALEPSGAARLRRIVDEDGGGADAVQLILANYSNDARAWRWRPVEPGNTMSRGFAGSIPVPLLRLFRNRRGFEYREPVHENITESVTEKNASVREEDIVIHHYGYAAAPGRAREKNLVYLDIARRKTNIRPNHAKSWLDLAELALAAGNRQEAETAARKAAAIDPNDIAPATSLANILLTSGRLDQARRLLEPFAGPGAPAHVLTALGAVAFRQGRVKDARSLLQRAVEEHPWAVLARACLARVLDVEGDHSAARKMLEAAQETAPALAEFAERIKAHEARLAARKAFDENRLNDALQNIRHALELDPEDPLTHLLAAAALEKAGHHEQAKKCRLQAGKLCQAL